MVPDVISTILAWVLGPVPRHALPVHLLVSSQETSASRTGRGVRLVNESLQSDFRRDYYFEAAVIP